MSAGSRRQQHSASSAGFFDMSRVIRRPGTSKQVRLALQEIKHTAARVGWFPSAVYEDGVPVAQVASWNEFGTRTAPPRSFMRATAEAKRSAWASNAHQAAGMILDGGVSVADGLLMLGEQAAGDIKRTISKLTAPPLSPRTVAAREARYAKGGVTSSLKKPLIETGIMINSLTVQVGPKTSK